MTTCIYCKREVRSIVSGENTTDGVDFYHYSCGRLADSLKALSADKVEALKDIISHYECSKDHQYKTIPSFDFWEDLLNQVTKQ